MNHMTGTAAALEPADFLASRVFSGLAAESPS